MKIRTVKKKNERQIKSKLKGKVQVVMANDKVTKRRERGVKNDKFLDVFTQHVKPTKQKSLHEIFKQRSEKVEFTKINKSHI